MKIKSKLISTKKDKGRSGSSSSSALAKRGKTQHKGSHLRNKKSGGAFDKNKKRLRDNIDAWDTGAGERREVEMEKKRHADKKVKFEPAPASFQMPDRTELLRKKMGDFAGPLLGTLWEADEQPTSTVDFTPKYADLQETTRKGNRFSALESSDEDESLLGPSKKKAKTTITFKPPTLTDIKPRASSFLFKNELGQQKSSSLFKAPTFDASTAGKAQQQPKFEIKAPTFVVGPSILGSGGQIKTAEQISSHDPDLDEL